MMKRAAQDQVAMMRKIDPLNQFLSAKAAAAAVGTVELWTLSISTKGPL